jgi:PAS domain S-box-containing protein/putative nucleotidyltransferase with HDIG domain
MGSNKRPVEKSTDTQLDKRLRKVVGSYFQKELGDVTALNVAEEGNKSSGGSKAPDSTPNTNQPLLKILDSIDVDYFADIVATIRDPLLVLSDDLQVLAANGSFYNTFKVKQKDTIGRQIYDLGNRQWNIPALRLLLENILPEKTVFNNYEVEHDFPFIGIRNLLLNARRIPAPPEKSQWILLSFEDVTERRRLERILQASEERFRMAFETATDYMLLIDKTSGRVLNSNRSARKMFGYSRRELLKMNLWELNILKDQQQFEQVSEELEKEGTFQILYKTFYTRGGQFPASINLWDRTGVIQCNIRDITASKQLEEKLRLSENELRALFAAMTDVVFVVDEAGRYLSIAPTNPINLYQPAQDMLGKTVYEVLPKELADYMVAKIGQSIQTNQTVYGEYALPIMGKEIWFESSATRLSENSAIWVAHDITEHKKAEKAILELARFPAENPNPVMRIDQAGTLLYANNAALVQLADWKLESGCPVPELLKRFTDEVFETDAAKTVEIAFGAQIFSFTIEPTPINNDINIYGLDITLRKQAEEKTLYQAYLLENVNDAVIGTDSAMRLISWNKAAEKEYGWKKEEILGQNVLEILRTEWADADVDEMVKEINAHGFWRGEVTQAIKDGRRTPVEMSTTVLRDDSGQITGYVSIIRDISERKKSEDALRESEEEYRNLFENSVVGISQARLDGQLIRVNRAYANMYGYENPEEMMAEISSIGEQLYAYPQDREKVLRILAAQGVMEPREIEVVRRDGTHFFVLATARAIKDSEGNVRSNQAEHIDITERKEATDKLRQTVEGTIKTIALIVEARDPYTSGHQKRVAEISVAIAKELGLPKEQIQGIYFASLIHDLGKIQVPAEILSKPGKLTKLEFDIIKTHSKVGYELLKGVDFPWPIAEIVYQHHERVNGSGYPRKLKGDRISIEAKIIGMADVFEAMSSHRPYRPSLGLKAALSEIKKNKGILYDPDIVEAFFKAIEKDKSLLPLS